MLRKLMLAAGGAMLALCSAAAAADMPVKAAPASPFLTYNGSGFYWAVGPSAKIADASANGNLLIGNLLSSNVNANGGGIDGEIGWIWGNASAVGFLNWYRVYASATYQNIASATTVVASAAGPQSMSVVSRWQAQEGFDFNADIFNLVFSTFGWPNPFPAFTPQPPSNLALATIPHQYVGVFVTEIGLGGNFGPATSGAQVGIAPGARTGFIWQTLGKDGKPNGAAFDTGVQVAWMTRGVTLDNVFAPNGAPVALHNSINMGTQYGVYAHLAF